MSLQGSQTQREVKTWGLHWFRRDLRVAGNEALRTNWKRHNGRVLGFFSFDSTFLSRNDFSHNRFAFFLKTLNALKKELQAQGGDLLVVDCPPLEAFTRLMAYLTSKKHFDKNSVSSAIGHPGADVGFFPSHKPSLVTWNRDYEPFARARDEKIKSFLQGQNVEIATHRDHLLFEPYEVLKSDKENDFYQIYSPYAKKWFSLLSQDSGLERLNAQKSIANYYSKLEAGTLDRGFDFNLSEWLKDSSFPFCDALELFENENQKNVSIEIPEAGSLIAFRKLQDFKNKLSEYQEARDFPAAAGTSRLSIYLKNGSLVSSQILSELKLQKITWETKSSANQFVKEIAWREFYYSILFHRPDVERTTYLSQYAHLNWENNQTLFKRWQEGTTGFPIVDAGMRELLQTGWMHNRVRMIVASFLTKDLLIDWKWGENHFMKLLLDGDLAPNNGGWQWAASTGCDPQPYFRIFNPWLQSAKFDPDGIYIKRHIPELRGVSAKALHDPAADRSLFGYPKPIVNHAAQKEKALALFKSAKQ